MVIGRAVFVAAAALASAWFVFLHFQRMRRDQSQRSNARAHCLILPHIHAAHPQVIIIAIAIVIIIVIITSIVIFIIIVVIIVVVSSGIKRQAGGEEEEAAP